MALILQLARGRGGGGGGGGGGKFPEPVQNQPSISRAGNDLQVDWASLNVQALTKVLTSTALKCRYRQTLHRDLCQCSMVPGPPVPSPHLPGLHLPRSWAAHQFSRANEPQPGQGCPHQQHGQQAAPPLTRTLSSNLLSLLVRFHSSSPVNGARLFASWAGRPPNRSLAQQAASF